MLHNVQRIIFEVTQRTFLRYLRQANINVNFSFLYYNIFFLSFTFVSTEIGVGMYFVSEVSPRKGTGKMHHFTRESPIVSSIFAPNEVLRSTSHPIEKFSVGKRLPLFPSRGRFTLIQVTPAKSGSDRWIRVLNYCDAHERRSHDRFEESLSSRARHSRNLRSFHSLYPRHLFRATLMIGIDIFIPPACSRAYPAKPRAVAHTEKCIL